MRLLGALCALAASAHAFNSPPRVARAGKTAFAPAARLGAAAAAPLVDLIPLAPRDGAASKGRARIVATATDLPSAVTSKSAADEKLVKYVMERGGRRVIRKVLIANNGMASLKTIMSIRQWAYMEFGDERVIQFIVMATPEDLAANAEFIRRADDFVEVPGGGNANNYANVQLIADLAVSQGVDAVMVGWGHASENPKLPDMLIELSKQLGREITFVGPTPPVMRVLGDKIGSTLLAQAANVPTIAWNGDGLSATLDERGEIPADVFEAACIKTEQEAIDSANRIGYPVMLKASEGGGGKGIRKAASEEELRAAYPQVVNEVPGSPVFLMQLCQGARHLEVQIIGDEHGEAIALSGRDCSTQRRHQKIFEEGPPTVAPPDVFREMEQAAVRLCKEIGYRSAGTVEYLYNAASNKYYFLELNPRLQVEHPVTEGLTGVSLPATQLQVAMGVPLSQIPQVRAFYGKSPYALDEPLDCSTSEPVPFQRHVIAARITAENPDEGFKPTSGRIDRINFQSTGNVWGYFSVTANGGVHEYADSQFGHLFASGPTREAARKSLVLALKELFIHGEIRTTVEYLIQLLETDVFKQNTLDTAWLDGLIASRSLGIKRDSADVVMCATVVRAFRRIKASERSFLSALEKGQFSIAPLREVTAFQLETTHESVKYMFDVTRVAPEALLLRVNGAETAVKVRQMADGSLLVMYRGVTHQVFATEEPLGLRMVLDGVTVLLPKAYDPSELRTDITGKVVRYLVPDGGVVTRGQPYVEVEAMKMIMPLKATEDGTLTQSKSAGSIIQQGDLLAQLELADPSKVQRIVLFDGQLALPAAPNWSADSAESALEAARAVERELTLVMDGYDKDVEPLVQKLLRALSSRELFPLSVLDAMSNLGNKLPVTLEMPLKKLLTGFLKDKADARRSRDLSAEVREACDAYLAALPAGEARESKRAVLGAVYAAADEFKDGQRAHAVRVWTAMLDKFAGVERLFVGRPMDAAILDLVKANKDALGAVLPAVQAHLHVRTRATLVCALLRALADFPVVFNVDSLRDLPPALSAVLREMGAYEGAALSEVALAARNFLAMKQSKPPQEALAELRADLARLGPAALAQETGLQTNLLPALFLDADEATALRAHEAYQRRIYSAYDIKTLRSTAEGGVRTSEWSFESGDLTPSGQGYPDRYGLSAALPELAAFADCAPALDAVLARYAPPAETLGLDDMVNVLHLIVPRGAAPASADEMAAQVQALLVARKDVLRAKGVRTVSVFAATAGAGTPPTILAFSEAAGYAEDAVRRGCYPTLHHYLELGRLQNFQIERLFSKGDNVQVYLGVEKPAPGGAAGGGKKGGARDAAPNLYVRMAAYDKDQLVEAAPRLLQQALDDVELARLDKRVRPTSSARIFLHVIPAFDSSAELLVSNFEKLMKTTLAANAPRLLKLSVDEIEVKIHCNTKDRSKRQGVRLMATSLEGSWLRTAGYLEYLDPVTGIGSTFCTISKDSGADPEVCMLQPYRADNSLDSKRATARRTGTTYAYDFLGLLERALIGEWSNHFAEMGLPPNMPEGVLQSTELALTPDGSKVAPVDRLVGTNDVGMVGWSCVLKTPEFPAGRPLVIVANDCTFQSGSFGVREDDVFMKVSEYARAHGYPRVHIASNSGARIGLADEVKPLVNVAWKDAANPAAGYEYLYLSEPDYATLPAGTVLADKLTVGGEARYRLDAVIGKLHGIGVENLRGSGMIAGETSRAYEDIFTLSYVTGRSVGIGAYLNRLGQRVIQKDEGPMILTGYSALNKLLGRDVYSSQDQLGGPQIMLPNGIAHMGVPNDQAGMEAVVRWLSYTPETVHHFAPARPTADPVDRLVDFKPTATPYDPRNFLAGTVDADGRPLRGFFDAGSFTEYHAQWGKSVVIGRARLGGQPVGVIAVETRMTETRIPADPANPASSEMVLQQAGQVWFPDSAFKTAQALSDFNHGERLPVFIFANWRGFSGGTRDMFGEVLKYGAYIVDALRKHDAPVFVYIPPHGELRGGSWVVVDPTINEEMMEMYAECNSRGGILEPPGICDIKFRKPDLLKLMARNDPVLRELSAKIGSLTMVADIEACQAQIDARQEALLPLYLQVAYEFADLHDRPGRMKAKGVIREVVPWETSRTYFYWRLKRRLAEAKAQAAFSQLAARKITRAEVSGKLSALATASGIDWEDDRAIVELMETSSAAIESAGRELAFGAVSAQLETLIAPLDAKARADLLAFLQSRVK